MDHTHEANAAALERCSIAIDMSSQLAAGDAAHEWLRHVFDLHSTLRVTAAHDVLEHLLRIISSLPIARSSSS